MFLADSINKTCLKIGQAHIGETRVKLISQYFPFIVLYRDVISHRDYCYPYGLFKDNIK
jgi:hypothetical protein